MNIHEFFFTSLRGASMPLSNYRGQPILIVNTASECGYTPQYKKLQFIWEDYKQSGLMVIGIPSNDFGSQEPGDEVTIDEFCTSNYSITFPMTNKQHVTGREAHPLFITMGEEIGEDAIPKWNFWKYLFSRQGQLLEFWPSNVLPDDPKITHEIEKNLQSWIL